MFYFVFCIIVVLSTFNLSSALLLGGIVHHLVVAFYPYDIDLNRQDRFV